MVVILVYMSSNSSLETSTSKLGFSQLYISKEVSGKVMVNFSEEKRGMLVDKAR